MTPTTERTSAVQDGARPLAPPAPRQAGVDRFDEAIVVTRTRAWIGLAACLALVAGVVIWASITTVDRTIDGRGVALVNGTLTRVLMPATGTIERMDVVRDDRVELGQVLGEVLTTADEVLELRAPITGQVINDPEGIGATLNEGQLAVMLAATSGPLVIKMFLPPAEAQQVEVGTPAKVAVPTGTVDGAVSKVGRLPLTPDQVNNAIGSTALGPILAAEGGVVEVDVTISSDEDTAQLASADVTDVTLIIGSQRPIEYVF